MKRLMIMALALVAFTGYTDCPQTDCPPPDGYLTAGDWGGEHWLFRVSENGYVYVETDCAHGTSREPVFVANGDVDFWVDMVPEGGPVVYPPEDPQTYPAEFVGTVCDGVLSFTYRTDTYASEGEVVYGEPPQLFKCL
ncbi:hypothetical protein D6833_11850 [Candidatus Parcubacteria bacterium]|nr:MAG: hypothetical protein D6833_11850 [Candidatus Parcubacteria bacterium]